MFIFYNPNPKHKMTTDCVLRMLSKIFNISWEEAFIKLCVIVLTEYEVPSSNYIWESLLERNGFIKRLLPNTCPKCMNVREFAHIFNQGTFVACTGSHVVAVINGNYFDSYDSGDLIVSYFYERRY